MTPHPGQSEPITAQPSVRNIGQLWAAFKARPHSYQIRILLALIVALAAIVFALPFPKSSTGRLLSDENPVPVDLDDHSRLLLAPHSELNLISQHAEQVEVQVVRGGARFQVSRVPTRRFLVVAADVEAATTAATLTVKMQNGAPRFSVDRGEVELRSRPEAALIAQLHAGESWPAAAPKPSQPEKTTAAPGQAAPEAPPAGAAAQVPEESAR
jgi:ferric-dicitrate binding protein FerR (iron transport regulator)